MAASPEREGKLIEKQKVLDALEIMHNKAMLSYAGRKPKGIARELNEMFLLSLAHQGQQLDLLKRQQTELAGYEREQASLGKKRHLSSALAPSQPQLNPSELQQKHIEELRVLKEKQKQEKRKKGKGKSKSSLAASEASGSIPSEAESQYLSDFVNELGAKIQNAENTALWLQHTIAYFKRLLLQPEIFDVHIQEQLEPIVRLLDSSELREAIAESLAQFRFIQNMTDKGSELNQKIETALKENFRVLEQNKGSQLETKLNRLYDSCMRCSDNKLVQRYMFTLLCEEVRKKYPHQKDAVNHWIRQKAEERAILASAPSSSPVVVSQPQQGSESRGSESRGENEKEEGKEEEKKREGEVDDNDEFENSASPFAGRKSPTPKIERHTISTSSMSSINSGQRGEGSSFVPASQDGSGEPSVSSSASQTLDAYATVFLTTEQKVQAGFEVGVGLVMLLGGFVLAASAFITIIPSFGTSLPVAGIGCAIGTAGIGAITLGLSKFGLFGQKAQESALSVDWRIDASSIAPYYMKSV